MTGDALLAADAAARMRALEAGSFIVEAPAGAGKTELLSQRYLRLLAGVAEPEEIVAITFTNKAAAEMRARILDSLAVARRGVVPEAAHKRVTFELACAALAASERRGWALDANPARLRILTIDALCASLARQMPVLSQFGAPPSVADDAQGHYDEAARRTLALLEDDGPAAEAVAAALRHFDNDATALGRLLAAMLARRDQWLRHALAPATESERGLRLLVTRDLVQVAGALDAGLQARLLPLAHYAAANADADSPVAALAAWSAPLAGAPAELPLWRGLRALLLTGQGEPRRALDKRVGFLPGKDGKPYKDAMLALLAEFGARTDAAGLVARIDALPEPRYTAEEWQTLDALAALLRLAAAQLWTVFRAARETDFIEIAQRALAALGEADAPSELALRLDYRVQHLLVDEFQDTSPTQVELLRRLTAGWASGDGRSLFAVGDPMQSIYRFRKADVGLFLRAADVGIGSVRLERLRLARNNRSCAKVVEWINGAFADVLPRRDSVTAGAIAYRAFAATRADAAGAGVRVHGLVVGRAHADEGAALEARRVLEIIDAERAADPRREIAVLVRARHHLAALVGEIRRHRPDLRFSAVDIEPLVERQCVQDLLSLTRALLHRADRVAWLAILRAPWCGLRLADLHALAGDDHGATLWSLINDVLRVERLSDEGRARLAHLRAVVGDALARRGRQPLARWIEGVWLALGGAGGLRGTNEVADARAYLDLVEQLDEAGRFSLDRIETEVAELYAAPDVEADGRLQFMTIHKAKGLEFDTVILLGLHRKARGDDAPLIRWEEVALEGMDECLVAAPVRRKGARRGEGPPSPFDYIGLLERERAANEAGRVLYVAATRAVRALHLVGVAQRDADGEAAPPPGTFLAALWPTVCAAFAGGDAAVAGSAAAPDAAFVPKLVRLAAPAMPAFLHASAVRDANAAPAAKPPPASVGDRLDVAVGTLVHGCLQTIADSGPAAWPAERVRGLAPALRAWLVRRGHAESEAAEGAQRAEAALLATLASAAGRWVLAPRAGAAAELALASRAGAGVELHVVDRSFVEDGVRWIIDYKTSRIDGDEGAFPVHAENFRAQLERYAALFADEGLPVRMAVFYAARGRLVELAQRA